MHKNPTDSRFIIASKICSTKQISKSVSNVLSSYTLKFKILKKNTKFLSNYNKLWILQSVGIIIQSLNYVNKKSVLNLLQLMTFQHYSQY